VPPAPGSYRRLNRRLYRQPSDIYIYSSGCTAKTCRKCDMWSFRRRSPLREGASHRSNFRIDSPRKMDSEWHSGSRFHAIDDVPRRYHECRITLSCNLLAIRHWIVAMIILRIGSFDANLGQCHKINAQPLESVSAAVRAAHTPQYGTSSSCATANPFAKVGGAGNPIRDRASKTPTKQGPISQTTPSQFLGPPCLAVLSCLVIIT
jgi:hypothetical protein